MVTTDILILCGQTEYTDQRNSIQTEQGEPGLRTDNATNVQRKYSYLIIFNADVGLISGWNHLMVDSSTNTNLA